VNVAPRIVLVTPVMILLGSHAGQRAADPVAALPSSTAVRVVGDMRVDKPTLVGTFCVVKTSVRWIVAALCLIALIAGGYLLGPSKPNLGGSFWNVLFDSRWVIGAARLVGLVFAAYVVASIAARIGRGQWVRRLGPIDTEAPVKAVTEVGGGVQEQLDEAKETIATLRDELERTLTMLDNLTDTQEAGIESDDAKGEGTSVDHSNEGASEREDREGPEGSS